MKILGRNIELPKMFSFKPSGKELGASGTHITQGYISMEDYVPDLQNQKSVSTYDEMRKSDGVVKASLLACTLPIRSGKWYIEPATMEDKDIEVADFVAYNLFESMTITWNDFLRQALTMLDFGFSVFEKVYTTIEYDGKEMIALKKLAPRLQDTILKWETKNGKLGVTQVLPTGEQAEASIPMEKLLVFVNQKEGDNWFGVSALRSAYRSWYMKKHSEQINAMSTERQGLGVPYAKMPKNYTPDDKKTAENILKNMRANEGAYVIEPADVEIGFKDMMSRGIKSTDETIRRYNREILISVLAQFLDLGSGNSGGSRALSADHSSTFHNNLMATAEQIIDVMNRYAIRQLVDLNFDVEEYPKLKVSNVGLPKHEAISKSISLFLKDGAITKDEKLEAYLRNMLSLPEKEEVDELGLPEETSKTKNQPKEKEIEDAGEETEASEKKTLKLSEFVPFRKLTLAEEKVNFKDIQRRMEQAENSLRIALSKVLSKSSNDLIRQMQVLLEQPTSAGRTAKLKELSIRYKGDYRKEIYDSIKEMFEYGKVGASKEMKVEAKANTRKDISGISNKADLLTAMMADGLINAGQVALLVGLQGDMSIPQIVKNVSNAIRKESNMISLNASAINIDDAINWGRMATFKAYNEMIYALQRSEVLDSRTCNFCMSMDERVFRKKDSITRTNSFHSNCRGLWVEILKEETDKPKITGAPKSVRDRISGTNDFKQLKKPIVKKSSSASKFLNK